MRLTRIVVLPVPAPAITTTLRSQVVSARSRSWESASVKQLTHRLTFCFLNLRKTRAWGDRYERHQAMASWRRQAPENSQ